MNVGVAARERRLLRAVRAAIAGDAAARAEVRRVRPWSVQRVLGLVFRSGYPVLTHYPLWLAGGLAAVSAVHAQVLAVLMTAAGAALAVFLARNAGEPATLQLCSHLPVAAQDLFRRHLWPFLLPLLAYFAVDCLVFGVAGIVGGDGWRSGLALPLWLAAHLVVLCTVGVWVVVAAVDPKWIAGLSVILVWVCLPVWIEAIRPSRHALLPVISDAFAWTPAGWLQTAAHADGPWAWGAPLVLLLAGAVLLPPGWWILRRRFAAAVLTHLDRDLSPGSPSPSEADTVQPHAEPDPATRALDAWRRERQRAVGSALDRLPNTARQGWIGRIFWRGRGHQLRLAADALGPGGSFTVAWCRTLLLVLAVHLAAALWTLTGLERTCQFMGLEWVVTLFWLSLICVLTYGVFLTLRPDGGDWHGLKPSRTTSGVAPAVLVPVGLARVIRVVLAASALRALVGLPLIALGVAAVFWKGELDFTVQAWVGFTVFLWWLALIVPLFALLMRIHGLSGEFLRVTWTNVWFLAVMIATGCLVKTVLLDGFFNGSGLQWVIGGGLGLPATGALLLYLQLVAYRRGWFDLIDKDAT